MMGYISLPYFDDVPLLLNANRLLDQLVATKDDKGAFLLFELEWRSPPANGYPMSRDSVLISCLIPFCSALPYLSCLL